MIKYSLTVLSFLFVLGLNAQIMVTGVFDGPLPGGEPKVIEILVVDNIADMSIYGVGAANNGGGTDGEEFTFPAVAGSAGEFIYISTDSTNFFSYFGFYPNYTSGAASINGDDAIEVFCNDVVIDLFGDIDVDGNGECWEYLDGWAYRSNASGPSTTFDCADWIFSGPNANDGETTHATAANPWPLGTFSLLPVQLLFFEANHLDAYVKLEWLTATEQNNDYFDVERSINEAPFTKVAELDGAGTSNQKTAYEWIDRNPSGKLIQYRLKQVDMDGTLDYSDIKSVWMTEDHSEEQVTIKYVSTGFQIDFSSRENGTVIVTNISGQQLVNQKLISGQIVNLPDYSGMIFIQAKTDKQQRTFVINRQ